MNAEATKSGRPLRRVDAKEDPGTLTTLVDRRCPLGSWLEAEQRGGRSFKKEENFPRVTSPRDSKQQ